MSGQQPFSKFYERIMRRIAEKGFNNGCFHQFAALMQGMIPPERNPEHPPSSSFSCEQLLEGIVQQLSVTTDDAAMVAQSYLDARLLVPHNGKLSDSNMRFRPDCSYVITKKGVKALIDVEHSRILTGDELSNLHDYQINTHLIYLDRTASGKISLGMNATMIMFRLFAGDETVKVNPPLTGDALHGMKSPDLSGKRKDGRRSSNTEGNGVPMKDRQHFLKKFSYTFTGTEAIDWLLEHVATVSRDEGVFLVSHFKSLGWLTNMNGEEVVRDQKNAVYYLTHKGLQEIGWADPSSEPGTPNRLSVGAARKNKSGNDDLRISTENLAKFDDFVRKSEHSDTVDSGWKGRNNHRGSVDMESRNQMPKSQSSKGRPLSAMIQDWENRGRSITASPGARKSKRSATVAEGGDRPERPASADTRTSTTARESTGTASPAINFADFFARESRGARLNQILENDEMLASFRTFLQSMYCEENLEFWLQTETFRTTYFSLFNSKTRRSTTWSLDYRTKAIREDNPSDELPETDDPAILERRQQMIAHAILLYLKFIKTESKFEVNNPSSIRREIDAVANNARQYFDLINNDSASTLTQQTADQFLAPGAQFSQLPSSIPGFHNMMFKSAHIHIFRLMATDSLPKYMRTEEYRALFTSLVERGVITVDMPASKRPSQAQNSAEAQEGSTTEAGSKSLNASGENSSANYVAAPSSARPSVLETIRNSTSDKVTPRSESDLEAGATPKANKTTTETIEAGTVSAS
ncbi:hypothetical protein BJ742DRAFT_904415 [Cladochytrium replicatum]|nr:hypothetical protein BJ742DRAFT_904415 [Cladochytrium replicatum]